MDSQRVTKLQLIDSNELVALSKYLRIWLIPTEFLNEDEVMPFVPRQGGEYQSSDAAPTIRC